MTTEQTIPGNYYTRFFTTINLFLDRISNGPVAIALFSIFLIVLVSVNLLDFPLSVPYMNRISGQDYLDMQGFYTAEKAYSLMEAFGAEGRRTQLLLLSTIDILIPSLSGLAGAVMITFLFRVNDEIASFRRIRWVALLAALMDYLENIGIFILISFYPAQLNSLAMITGILTLLKFIFYFFTIFIILIGIVYHIYNKYKKHLITR